MGPRGRRSVSASPALPNRKDERKRRRGGQEEGRTGGNKQAHGFRSELSVVPPGVRLAG